MSPAFVLSIWNGKPDKVRASSFMIGTLSLMRMLLTAIMLIAFAVSTCKGKPGSSLKTLDNIASGKPIYDACEGNFPMHAQGQKLPTHLQKALKAVPYKVQQGFFDDLTGTIEVVDSFSETDCPDMLSLNPKRADDLMGCWQRLPQQNNSIKIILRRQPAEPNKEQYTLTRIFGFVYGDILANRVIPRDGASKVQFAQVSPNFTLYRRLLASTFLGELSLITTPADRPNATQMLAQLGIGTNLFNTDNDAARNQSFLASDPKAVDAFSSRVIGEAFHSRFCTSESFIRACAMFHNTMTQFKPYADDATDQNSAKCPSIAKVLIAGGGASSTHTEYFAANDQLLTARRQAHLDNGASANAQIASTAMAAGQGLALGGLDIQSVMGLLSGGGTGQSTLGSFMGFLQMLLWTGGPSIIPGIPGYPTPFPGVNPTPVPAYPTPNPNYPTTPPGTVPTPVPTVLPSGGGGTAEEMAAFNATNAYRTTRGLPALQFDSTLLAECRQQAKLQITNGLNHWIQGQGTSQAENIAYGQNTGAQVAQTWIDSPGHNANIIAERTYMAVGADTSSGTVQWCQRFR